MHPLQAIRATLRRARERGASGARRRSLAVSGRTWRRALLAAASTLVLAGVLAGGPGSPALQLREGEVAPRDVVAPRDFVDRAATDATRQRAAAAVPDVYTQDPAVAEAVLRDLREAFARARTLRDAYAEAARDQAPDAAEWAARVSTELGLRLTDEVALAVLGASRRTLSVLEQGALDVARSVLAEGVKPEALEAVRRRVPEAVAALEFDRPYAAFVSLLVQDRLRPNLFHDREATEAARRRAAGAVEPVVVRRNQVIVRQGEVVRAEHLQRLRDAGVLAPGTGRSRLVGALLLAALAVGLMAAYLHLFEPRLVEEDGRLTALVLAGLGVMVAARLVLAVPELQHAALLPAGSMLIALLLSPRVALAYTAMGAPLLAVAAGTQPVWAWMSLVGGLVGLYSVTRVGARADLLVRAGAAVGLSAFVVLAGDRLLAGVPQASDPPFWLAAGLALLSGPVAAIATMGSLPYLEGAFGIVTPLRLLELGNPNHPLLRRLLMEAPGTYHHSLMVANLAEAATERVGGNSLLARVGSYYHDVGKLKRPAFFIENQFGAENPHDRISPHLSAMIIVAHVRDGVELARQYRLPREIVRFIEEHHGTLRVEYFYRKAEETAGDQQVMTERFRYPGPVPQTRETAICMLADGCEAAVRAMARPSPARIEATVRKIIRDRLNEGQLDRCDLTLRDLDTIAETFVRVLTGLVHQRIEYPEGAAELAAEGPRRGRGTRARQAGNGE